MSVIFFDFNTSETSVLTTEQVRAKFTSEQARKCIDEYLAKKKEKDKIRLEREMEFKKWNEENKNKLEELYKTSSDLLNMRIDDEPAQKVALDLLGRKDVTSEKVELDFEYEIYVDQEHSNWFLRQLGFKQRRLSTLSLMRRNGL